MVQGVGEVAKLRAERGLTNPKLNINTTLFETNYRNLNEIVEIADEMGADNINFHHPLFINKKMYDDHNQIFNQITPDWLDLCGRNSLRWTRRSL